MSLLKQRALKYSAGILFVFCIASLSWFDVFQSFELETYDLRFNVRPTIRCHPDIVLIDIDDRTLDQLGRWPFKRDYHAHLIDALTRFGARKIVFDILFSEPGPGDEELAVASKKANNIYYPIVLRLPQKKPTGTYHALDIDTDLIQPLKSVTSPPAHINITADIDGKRRKAPLFVTHHNTNIPFLPLKLAMDILGLKNEDVVIKPGRIQLGPEMTIPVDQNLNILINFAGKWKDTFKHYSYIDILTADKQVHQGEASSRALSGLKDKIYFVGLTATGTHDMSPVPVETVYPMVGIHANVLNSILLNNFIARVPRGVNVMFLFVLTAVVFIVTFKANIFNGLVFLFGLLTFFISGAVVLFVFSGLWADIFCPVVVSIGLYIIAIVYRYLEEQKKRMLIDKELSLAKNIQLSFLPQRPSENESVEIGATLLAAKGVAGDLYDFVDFSSIDKNKTGLVIGDVSGKGMPAALFMAMSISYFRFLSKNNLSTVDVITQLNRYLIAKTHSGLFITILYMIYDSRTQTLIYTNGGHLPTFLVKKGREEVSLLTSKEGMLVGLIQDAPFSQEQIKLERGDLIVQYTDGIVEARNTKKEEFGEARLKKAVLKHGNLSSQDIATKIQEDVVAFAGKQPQHDDSTVLVLKIKE